MIETLILMLLAILAVTCMAYVFTTSACHEGCRCARCERRDYENHGDGL